MFNHIMLDLETLGKDAGCVIVTVGACAFNFETNTISDKTFYATINTASSVQHGLSMDIDTVMWWMGQSDAARAALISKNSDTLPNVLTKLTAWIEDVRKNAPLNQISVWGNDIDFDISIMKAAYKAVDHALPWSFWEHRSVRTMVWLGKERNFDPKKDMPFDGIAHNALADAIHQAKYCMAIKNVLDLKA